MRAVEEMDTTEREGLLADLVRSLGGAAARAVIDRIHPPERPEPNAPLPRDQEPIAPLIITPDDRFASKQVDAAGGTRIAVLRSAFTLNGRTVEEACGPGRYRALALTALEEACMWAIKSVSHEPVR